MLFLRNMIFGNWHFYLFNNQWCFNWCFGYYICRQTWLACSNLATPRNLLPSVAKVEKSLRKESFFVPPTTSLRRPLFFLWYQIPQRPTILWSSKDKKSAKPEPPSGNKKGGKVEIARNSLFFCWPLFCVFYLACTYFLISMNWGEFSLQNQFLSKVHLRNQQKLSIFWMDIIKCQLRIDFFASCLYTQSKIFVTVLNWATYVYSWKAVPTTWRAGSAHCVGHFRLRGWGQSNPSIFTSLLFSHRVKVFKWIKWKHRRGFECY